MSVEGVIDAVHNELRRRGIPTELKPNKSRGFADPAGIGFTVRGQDHLFQFWEGSHKDEDVAEDILVEVLAAVWKLPRIEAKGRLEHEKSQARR